MNDPLDQLRLRFTGLRQLSETAHGQVYAGQDFTGADVTVAVLSESAAADPAVRNSFADAVWRHSPGAVPDEVAVHAADLHAARPWAAIRNPVGRPGAEQLLAGLSGAAAAPPLATPPTPPPTYPPASAPGSPAYAPGSPAYPPASAPRSPAYAPGSPAYPPASAPGSPAYAPGSPAYAPSSPAYSPGYPPPRGGGHPSAPARSGSPWPWLIGVAASVLALVVVVGVVVVAVRLLGGEDDPTVVLPNPPPAPLPTDQPLPPPPGSSGEPELRDVEPISLIGPTWGEDEDTYTMAFDGWPFAFRTPPTWGCIGTSYPSIPDAPAWHCINEADPDNGQQVNVMLWECATSCTESEQQDMVEAWLDDPQDAVGLDDPPVAYVEYDPNYQGNYAIDLSHFGGAGGELRWHIGVYAESPSETADDVLKVLNDILSQSA